MAGFSGAMGGIRGRSRMASLTIMCGEGSRRTSPQQGQWTAAAVESSADSGGLTTHGGPDMIYRGPKVLFADDKHRRACTRSARRRERAGESHSTGSPSVHDNRQGDPSYEKRRLTHAPPARIGSRSLSPRQPAGGGLSRGCRRLRTASGRSASRNNNCSAQSGALSYCQARNCRSAMDAEDF